MPQSNHKSLIIAALKRTFYKSAIVIGQLGGCVDVESRDEGAPLHRPASPCALNPNSRAQTYGTIEETNPAPDEESRRKRIHVAWKAVGICAVVALASIGTIAMKDGNMGALETLVSQKHKKKHHSHSRKHRSSQEPMHTPGPTSVAVNPPTPNPPDSFLIPTPPPTTTTPAPTSVAESHHRSVSFILVLEAAQCRAHCDLSSDASP